MDGLFSEPIEDVDELVQLVPAFGFTFGKPISDTVIDVVPEHRQADSIEGRLSGRQLLKDLNARTRLLDHASNAANLAFDAVEAPDERLLFRSAKYGRRLTGVAVRCR
jgi:hypothetical protein